MCRVRFSFALALAFVLLSGDFADAGIRDWLPRRARVTCPGNGGCGGRTNSCPCVEPAKCSPQSCPTSAPYPLPAAVLSTCPNGQCGKVQPATIYGK